jgi:hypothetical protein
VEAADDVRYRDTNLRRLVEAGYAHDASPRLDQKVIPWTVLILPRTEAGYGTVDNIRVQLLERLVAEAKPLQSPAAHVLDEHVGLRPEAPYPLEALRVLEIHAYRALVAVDGEEIGRLAAGEGRSPVAGVVAALRVLDLDHVGTEIG